MIAGLARPIQHKLWIPAHAILDIFRIIILVWAAVQMDTFNRMVQIIALKIHATLNVLPIILLNKFARLAVQGIYYTKEIV